MIIFLPNLWCKIIRKAHENRDKNLNFKKKEGSQKRQIRQTSDSPLCLSKSPEGIF